MTIPELACTAVLVEDAGWLALRPGTTAVMIHDYLVFEDVATPEGMQTWVIKDKILAYRVIP